ncbi:MAG: RNA 2',3'-cyclic phosphodiesterase [Acidobacteria bacterium]|nr:RNA 2',3'-cyclic phosphodiesterase [Acidobacteriota bacterium]
MRLFFSLPLPPDAEDRISRWMGGQGLIHPGHPPKLHLTVAFLGEVAPELAQLASACGAAVASRHGCFDLATASLGTFPRSHGSQVVFLAVDPSLALHALVSDLRQTLALAGVPMDPKPFHPHLTLARPRVRFPLPQEPPSEAWTVDRLHLVESIPGAEGVRHETRFHWPLGGARA